MKLNLSLAQNIVQRTNRILHKPINVMDENGIIIASSNPNRLQQKHTGAVLAIRRNQTIEINQELAEQWQFEVQPGINLPISYLGEILGVVGISGDPETVRSYGELVKMTAELMTEQHFLLEKERWDKRYKEEFILSLLKGKLDEIEIEQQSAFFGLTLEPKSAVIIIQILQPTAEKLQQLVGYLEQSAKYPHFAILSHNKIALIQPSNELQNLLKSKELPKLFPSHLLPSGLKGIKIAIGTEVETYKDISLSFQTALSTLNYGQTYFPKKSVYYFNQYKLPALLDNLRNSWQSKELLKPLDDLYQQDENRLLEKTLQQYFLSNCDLALTSQQLFIHINTLRYRLNKIEKMTGLSFNKIDEKFILYLSTLLNH
ncbi:helix-turn-helix domain-containing protein [Haemophilus haemoglobinophilus]|nr:helix-turn-helix domain-containing protein [Canicola haemoglobinophilus]MBN6711907.1 helix-turn-helix domain-containing protein [Canicola haemoglobinophilus]